MELYATWHDSCDNSAVVFVSCVLKYVDNLEADLREIARIAGSPEKAFIVNVQPKTMTATLYPGARWRDSVSAASGETSVDMQPVSLEEKLILTGALGAALAAAFWPRP